MQSVGISRRFAVLSLAGLLAACATAETVDQKPIDAGVARTFNASPEKVREAFRTAMQTYKIETTTEEDTPEHYLIRFFRPPRALSYGEVGRIVIDKTANPPTTARIIYDRRGQMYQFANTETSFATTIYTEMERQLAR